MGVMVRYSLMGIFPQQVVVDRLHAAIVYADPDL